MDLTQALKVLDSHTNGEATNWYEFRKQSEFTHIVDHKTGKWVSQFKANGVMYYIKSPSSGIGPLRYTELMKRMPAVAFDSTFAAMRANVKQAIDCANTIGTAKHDIKGLFEALINLDAGIARNDREWQMSFILCTLFIVTKDEDLSSWSFEDSKEKLNNWSIAKIHEQDFFFLAMYWRTLHSKWFEPLPQQIQQLVSDWNPLL